MLAYAPKVMSEWQNLFLQSSSSSKFHLVLPASLLDELKRNDISSRVPTVAVFCNIRNLRAQEKHPVA